MRGTEQERQGSARAGTRSSVRARGDAAGAGGRARPLSPPLGRSGAAPAPCARGPSASRQSAAADLPCPALPSLWPKLPLALGVRPWRASAARGPRQRASLQLRRPEFWVGVRRLHQSGLQVPGLRAAAGRGGELGSAVSRLEFSRGAGSSWYCGCGRAGATRTVQRAGVPAQRPGHAPPRAQTGG